MKARIEQRNQIRRARLKGMLNAEAAATRLKIAKGSQLL